MQIGMVGLGRMGNNMAERLRRAGHDVVGYDRFLDIGDTASLAELVGRLSAPRVVWVMVPSGAPTQEAIDELSRLLAPGDVIVDGGNSYFRDSIRRAEALADDGLTLIDAGTSGGIWGLENGYCLMVGGSAEAIERLRPAFETLAPPDGWRHVGAAGSGHFVKMIHNGIEYGLLQAYAEGFDLLRGSKLYPHLDLHGIAELWRHGSVIRSWLLDLTAVALRDDPQLERIEGYVADSGEGRWTILEALEEDVPAPITALSLFARFASRQQDSYAMKLIAALREQFGGHATKDIP